MRGSGRRSTIALVAVVALAALATGVVVGAWWVGRDGARSGATGTTGGATAGATSAPVGSGAASGTASSTASGTGGHPVTIGPAAFPSLLALDALDPSTTWEADPLTQVSVVELSTCPVSQPGGTATKRMSTRGAGWMRSYTGTIRGGHGAQVYLQVTAVALPPDQRSAVASRLHDLTACLAGAPDLGVAATDTARISGLIRPASGAVNSLVADLLVDEELIEVSASAGAVDQNPDGPQVEPLVIGGLPWFLRVTPLVAERVAGHPVPMPPLNSTGRQLLARWTAVRPTLIYK